MNYDGYVCSGWACEKCMEFFATENMRQEFFEKRNFYDEVFNLHNSHGHIPGGSTVRTDATTRFCPYKHWDLYLTFCTQNVRTRLESSMPTNVKNSSSITNLFILKITRELFCL